MAFDLSRKNFERLFINNHLASVSPDTKRLVVQRVVGNVLVFPVSSLLILFFKFVLGYKINNIKETRKHYKKIRKNTKLPLLICSNHLTLIDSLIIHWALASTWHYTISFKDLAWSIPDIVTSGRTIFTRAVSYIGKCIPIDRMGPPEHHKNVIKTILFILRLKHPVHIFPEGGRSRYPFIKPNDSRYGVGKIIQNLDRCNVLAVYMRGSRQKKYSDYPKKNNTFTLFFDIFEPKIKHYGLAEQRDVTLDIMDRLKKMEEEFFKLHPDLKQEILQSLGQT